MSQLTSSRSSDPARAPRPASARALSEELAFAARHGLVEKLLALLSAGADPLLTHDLDSRGIDSRGPALLWAARHGQTECVEILAPVSKRAFLDDRARSALSLAAAGGHARCVELLLDPALARTPDAIGRTPLMLAAAAGGAQAVNSLLPLSDPEAVDVNGRGAFWLAWTSSRHLIPESLAHPASVLAQLRPFFDPNRADATGETLLMLMCRQGMPLAQLEALISLGSDLTVANNEGQTAPDLAARHSHFELVFALLPRMQPAAALQTVVAALDTDRINRMASEKEAAALNRLFAELEAKVLLESTQSPAAAVLSGDMGNASDADRKPAIRL